MDSDVVKKMMDEIMSGNPHIEPLEPASPSLHSFGMPETPSREEINAKLEAAEARAETQFVRLEHGIGALAEAVGGLKADNKFTRWTIVGTGLTSLLAVAGIVFAVYQLNLQSQANLLSAFQTGLTALQAKPFEPPKQ